MLELEDDAVHVHLGGDWRMPTYEEFQELYDACNTTWTPDYNGTGVAGWIFILKSDSSKQLFFPAAGYGDHNQMYDIGSYGYYWSSSLSISSNYAYSLYFHSTKLSIRYFDCDRYYGQSVRGVLSK